MEVRASLQLWKCVGPEPECVKVSGAQESIPGLLKRLQIQALDLLSPPFHTHHYPVLEFLNSV
jgi:hypothetical protein